MYPALVIKSVANFDSNRRMVTCMFLPSDMPIGIGGHETVRDPIRNERVFALMPNGEDEVRRFIFQDELRRPLMHCARARHPDHLYRFGKWPNQAEGAVGAISWLMIAPIMIAFLSPMSFLR